MLYFLFIYLFLFFLLFVKSCGFVGEVIMLIFFFLLLHYCYLFTVIIAATENINMHLDVEKGVINPNNMTPIKSSSGEVRIDGKMAYCPQIPWITSDTVRNNITFTDKGLYSKYIFFFYFSFFII
jgi:hypothetical protein